jgi:hypothetical protein
MIRAFEAMIDERGDNHLLESIHLPAVRRALVIILEEEPALSVSETAWLSELALAEDGTDRRRMKCGHTCSRYRGPSAVSVSFGKTQDKLRPVTGEAAACCSARRCWSRRLDSVSRHAVHQKFRISNMRQD